jgi:hypothetical protein
MIVIGDGKKCEDICKHAPPEKGKWPCEDCDIRYHDRAEGADSEDDYMIHTECIRCGKHAVSVPASLTGLPYTNYSYCEDCLREGLKLLKKQDEQTIEERNMSDIVIVNNKIYVSGDALMKTIDAVVCDELPVDKQWASGLRYAKRLIRNMMGVEQEDDARTNGDGRVAKA